jgi:SMC interacting uncharacterized protein involved in chromosome segregation
LKELEQQRIYETFPAVRELKEIIKNHEIKIIDLQSEERIENSLTVKRLREEKKEIDNRYQELQKEISEKKEQIQNLLLRQKGQGKGQDFEK